ncbi:MAG: LLM class flavin-dependent oxidoreductase [Geodermatophilaceae bacterium]|nr:LLM class flavin-dependent oxidoreductase [Geodermatophilaceae bacterium]
MRIGIVILPELRRAELVRRWGLAEAYGFDHAWTYDHLGWRTLVDSPWYSAVPTLSAAAMVTSRIQLGTFVASPNFRHPVPFARELTALDDLSEGRLLLGIGSGGIGYDTAVLGEPDLPLSARTDRFVEFVELLDSLLTQSRTTWTGTHYSVVEARVIPGCVQAPRIPFVVAANGPRAMRLSARYGHGWATSGNPNRAEGTDWWDALAGVCRRFTDVLAEEGRDPATMPRYLQVDAGPVFSMSSVECFRDALGRAAELGFTDVVTHWPRADGPYAGSEQTLEHIAAEVLASTKPREHGAVTTFQAE